MTTNEIEMGCNFTREEYETLRASSQKELLNFDDFLEKVKETTLENGGSLEDAVFIADDAFRAL